MRIGMQFYEWYSRQWWKRQCSAWARADVLASWGETVNVMDMSKYDATYYEVMKVQWQNVM